MRLLNCTPDTPGAIRLYAGSAFAFGCASSSSAAAPDTTADDMLVPDNISRAPAPALRTAPPGDYQMPTQAILIRSVKGSPDGSRRQESSIAP